MNRSESKYFQTAERMDEALVQLLQKKELPYITVREICSTAGVNRSTFYLHYNTIVDLLTESMEYVNRRFMSYFPQDADGFVADIREMPAEKLMLVRGEYLIPFLNFIRENRSLYAASVEHPETMQSMTRYDALWKYIIDPVMDRYRVPADKRKYYLAFYLTGLIGVIMEWVKQGCAVPPEEISGMIEGFFKDL